MTTKTYDGPYFKALDEEKGTFEAVVSVFGNVDYQGDRVMPGAFEKSLERWRKTGDPIPVIWSHDWADPFAHIGWVSPADAFEVTKEQAKAFAEGIVGGLYVKGQLDVDKPFARQVYDLLKSRRVKEWSFAYDVIDDAPSKDIPGATDLRVLDVHEVGPTLKGANGATTTLGVKQMEGIKVQLEMAAGVERGLKKITAALDVDQEVGLKMLKDWVAEDIQKSAAANLEAAKEQHNGGIDGLRQHLVDEHGKTQSEVEDKDEAELRSMHDAIKHDEDEEKTVGTVYVDVKPRIDTELLELLGIDAEKAALKPWHIEEREDQFCVILDSDGSVEKCHPTRAEAMAHMRALYAAEAAETGDASKADLTTIVPLMPGTTIIPGTVTYTNGTNTATAKAGRALNKETETKLRSVIETLQGIVDSAAAADAEPEKTAPVVEAPDAASLKELEEYKRKLGLLEQV